MRKLIYILLIGVFSINSYGQNEDLFERLSVLIDNGVFYYNTGNYTITSQTLNYDFNSKGLKKVYRKFKIKKNDVKIKDDSLNRDNFYVNKNEIISDRFTEYNSYYFVENKNRGTTIIQFASNKKRDSAFERNFVNLIMDYSIPKRCYMSSSTDSINFAGRLLKLGGSCYWQNINSVLCPYNGAMNWSVHSTLEDAKLSNDVQFEHTRLRKNGKVIKEEFIDIKFEGVQTKAKKVIYDIKGINSLLVGMSGAKSLTIYYVVAKVRGNYISCVLSHWDNDTIRPSGIPALLEEVMTLK